MSSPFFSVLIPTKNKSKLVVNAIESTLRQSFGDFELLIIDNDDSDNTKNVAEKYLNDKRVKYIRTGGFSMPENWQFAIESANGEYTTILTDRMMFSSKFSLERLYSKILSSRSKIISYAIGNFNENNGSLYTFNEAGDISYTINLKDLIKSFLVGNWDWACHRLPKGLNSLIHKDYLNELIKTYGKVCIPCSPDYNLGFLTALHFIDEKILYLDESFIVQGFYRKGFSNGYSTFSDFNDSLNYLRTLKEITVEDIMKKTYLKNYSPVNTIFYDFINAVEITNKAKKISWKNVNMFFYIFENYRSISQQENNPNKEIWLADLKEKLLKQPDFIQEKVLNEVEKFKNLNKSPTLFFRAINYLNRKIFSNRNSYNEIQLKFYAIPYIERYDNDQYHKYLLEISNF